MRAMNSEELVPVCDVPRWFHRCTVGRRVRLSTVYRWMNRGVHGVRLRAVHRAGRVCITLDDLEDFLRLTSIAEDRHS